MNAASEISDFMVAAGAFAVGGRLRTDEEAKRLSARMHPLRAAMSAPHDRAVRRAVEALARDGVSEKGMTRLLTALAGRAAALAAKKDTQEPCGLASRARMQMGVDLGGKDESAVTVMTPERHAAITARFPYKDDTLED